MLQRHTRPTSNNTVQVVNALSVSQETAGGVQVAGACTAPPSCGPSGVWRPATGDCVSLQPLCEEYSFRTWDAEQQRCAVSSNSLVALLLLVLLLVAVEGGLALHRSALQRLVQLTRAVPLSQAAYPARLKAALGALQSQHASLYWLLDVCDRAAGRALCVASGGSDGGQTTAGTTSGVPTAQRCTVHYTAPTASTKGAFHTSTHLLPSPDG
jgi:hypothetical protein